MMLPLAMLLCALMAGTVSAKVRFNGLVPYQHVPRVMVPYTATHMLQVSQQHTSAKAFNYSQVTLAVPSGQTGFRDWVVTLSQNNSPVYTFYTWQSPNFSWTSEWVLGSVDPGVYDVTVQCVNDPSGGYYADIFWDCPDSNDMPQSGGDQDIYSVFNDPYSFGNIDINGTLYINTSCNH